MFVVAIILITGFIFWYVFSWSGIFLNNSAENKVKIKIIHGKEDDANKAYQYLTEDLEQQANENKDDGYQ